ncbi:peroxin-16 [Marchantia polymorpha subsp. ruderalis]|uniref:Peroxisomal membrane protein PEX16 n=2 Tax=Marchantia polymorpha TaxID=3197 RepID=A0AAF6BRT1_MARPO|nr:hypothetical protein MARPO_0047s0037 [Marchantia polymorpha]BBN14715.1 hypothetical protein Mp_6g13850 [Marchantia polymorpha subsp. ruderalis]|eukprot:PTQ39054.1 hypothetical protein MARPO_0047s0037 [Marchantia polymorpha]
MMEAYKEWVRHNRQWISSLESLANTATWFLPERFANYELASEAVSTLLGLVTVMNQHIVETAPPARRPRGSGLPTPALQPEQDESFPWALCVSVMKEVEVLTEMAAETYLGKDQKWAPVASIEAIKALLRLIILRNSGYKILLDGGETKNCEDPTERSGPSSPDEGSRRASQGQDMPGRPGHQAPGPSRPSLDPAFYPRDLEGRAMQAMHKFGAHNTGQNRPSWVRQRPGPPQDFRIIEQHSYVPRPFPTGLKQEPAYKSRGFLAGEVLLISRPLLYVLLVWRYGLKSWRPWLSALSIDLIGMYLVSSATSAADRRLASDILPDMQQVNDGSLSTRERQELRRRQLLWALYVMRNPFFDRYTRRPLERVERILSPVPIVGTLAGKAVELLYAVQGFYSYTAAS